MEYMNEAFLYGIHEWSVLIWSVLIWNTWMKRSYMEYMNEIRLGDAI